MVSRRYASFAFMAAALAPQAMGQLLTVEPYLQPGDAPTLKHERKIVLWQTKQPVDTFAVEFGLVGGRSRGVRAQAISLPSGGTLYAAQLDSLAFDATYFYRLRHDGKPLREAQFSTRTRGSKVEFAVVGDCGIGSIGQSLIAAALVREQPSFVLVTGDFVYSNGRASEYERRLFPFYNAPLASNGTGAPIMRSTPFYVALGNHDMNATDLGAYPDGLAAFYYLRPPLNGPTLDSAPKARGPERAVESFKTAAGDRWPKMANYWFDTGNVRVAVLDANNYANPLEPALIGWLDQTFQNAHAKWKFIAFHEPGFHSSIVHYDYQKMRLLAPVFERLGIDVVFSGHVHNYQRSKPLTFKPAGGMRADGTVPGSFVLDDLFDGDRRTKARGVVYIVTGAGGAPFYDPGFTNRPERWEREGGSWAPFTERFVANTHSFTRVRVDGNRVRIAQLDPYSNELDAFTLTK